VVRELSGTTLTKLTSCLSWSSRRFATTSKQCQGWRSPTRSATARMLGSRPRKYREVSAILDACYAGKPREYSPLADGWLPRPKVLMVLMPRFQCLKAFQNFEVLAVNSHGGSSPPPRTSEISKLARPSAARDSEGGFWINPKAICIAKGLGHWRRMNLAQLDADAPVRALVRSASAGGRSSPVTV